MSSDQKPRYPIFTSNFDKVGESWTVLHATAFWIQCDDLGIRVANKAYNNLASRALIAYACKHDYSVDETLSLFGEHYQDVLRNPAGRDHPNIRALYAISQRFGNTVGVAPYITFEGDHIPLISKPRL